MIKSIAQYLASIPPVFIDGLLWTLIPWFVFNQTYFGGDEASKFISAETKFWLNWGIGSAAVMAAAVKNFRSTSYADHQAAKKAETWPPFKPETKV